MLRMPIKILLIFAAITGIILGTHGLWVYFNTVGLLPTGAPVEKLYMSIDVPVKFHGMVKWITLQGLRTWVSPVLIIAGSIFCWCLQNKIPGWKFSYYLRKLHLW